MSAFYDLASVVLVPSGYKSGKIYAQKPLTTDGQLTFTRASTATRVNASGLIEEVASGVPRLDYTNSSCPKLLLEPQRTNVLINSETLNLWVASALGISSVDTNYAISPDGTQNAEKINFVVQADSDLGLTQNFVVSGGQTYAQSIYLKGEGSDIGKQIVVKTKRVSGSSAGTAVTYTLTGDWVRVAFNTTYAANNTTANFYISSNEATSVLAWGAQVEAGAYATSYVKTEAAAVTRLADIANKTSISSLIGATEGVMFMDCILPNGVNPILMQLANNTSSFSQSLYVESVAVINTIRCNFYDSGLLQATFSLSGATVGQRYKIAAAYKQNDFALYINGVQIGVDTSGTVQAGLQDLQIGHLKGNTGVQDFNGNTVNQALLFKTRLTNAQLAELTSL
jgi:hypothetical protein